jgi:tol-pal system protein YbgF
MPRIVAPIWFMATNNRLSRPWGWAFACAFALAQPASAALFGSSELTQKTQALQQRVDALDARLDKLDARLDQMDAALQKNQQLLGLLKEVELLKAEVAKLRGQAEVQMHQLDTMGKRQNDLYADLDQRLADLARAAQSAPAPAAADASPQADAQAESRSYDAALKLFREASYPGAIAGFKDFLKTYPASEMAANAQYWIGYSYYALKDYKTSLLNQQKLVATYPASPKVPDALLNIAANQIALDNLNGARKTLKDLVAKHPGSEAAKLAARRLSVLK